MPPPRLKRSNTAGAVPASLEDAEIAINQADGKLFYRTAAGGVASFSALPSANSTMTGVLTVQPAVAPAAPDGSVHVIGDNTNAAVTVQRNGESAGQPALRFKRSRGTAASPTVVQTGDTMGVVAWHSITTTGAVASVGQISIVCTQTPQVGDLAGRSEMRLAVGNGSTVQVVCAITPTACNFSTAVNVNGQSVVVTNDARLSDTRTPTDASVTTAKLADGSVTTAKIAEGAVITVDIANSAVTYAKIQNVSATDRLLGRSSAGAGAVEEITCTAFGRSLLDDASASAARTTLGLGTMATAATADYLPRAGGTLTGVTTISATAGAATLQLTGVAGSAQLAQNEAGAFYLTNYVTNSQIIYNLTGSGAFRFYTNASDVARIDSKGISVGVSGSAALPAIGHTTDANTGLLFPAADTLAVTTGGVERLRVEANGRLGVGTTSPTATLDVNGDTIRLRTPRTPASASASGNQGDICFDTQYLYVCIAPNSWARVAISPWP